VGSYPISSQSLTHVEVELGCDNFPLPQTRLLLVSTKAQLDFSMPLFSHVFFCFVVYNHNSWAFGETIV
jgi:hypothetical protein